MTDAETYLTELDRVLRWQPREKQQRRLGAELTLWLGKLRADETGVAAAIVGGLTARRRAVLAARGSAVSAISLWGWILNRQSKADTLPSGGL